MTIQEEFDEFLSKAYPAPPSESDAHWVHREQHKQLRNAFFAGVLVGFGRPKADFDDTLNELRAFLEGHRIREGIGL